MSRFLAAFLAADEKVRFSEGIAPTKSEKAKNPPNAPPEYLDTAAEGGGRDFSPFSPLWEQHPQKNALFEGGPEAPVQPLPTGAAALLAYVRDDLHCRVELDGETVRIGPTHRCPPAVVAAVQAVLPDLRRLLAAEGGAILGAGGDTTDPLPADSSTAKVPPAADGVEPAVSPPAALVERLALAMAAPRPWQRCTGPEGLAYCRQQARRRLDTLAGNPMAQGLLVSAEEAAARRYAAMVEHARGTRR